MATEPKHTVDSSIHPAHALARASLTAPIGLILIARDGTVLTANTEAIKLLQTDSKEVLHQPAIDLFGNDDVPVRDILVDCIERKRAYSGRTIVRTRSGISIDCDLAVYPIEDGGEVWHALWLNDVSEHVAMQRSLLQAERLSALGEIIAGVAHELNNPLTGILGYAELLLDTETSEKNRQRLEHILNEAMRCEAIVQSLRGFSSRDSAEQAHHSINQIVDNMVTLLEYQMRVDGIDITRSFTEDAPTAFVDAHGLGRAILNIVHNAHQALQLKAERPREFTVRTEADAAEVRIQFQDNGPGIHPEHISRVFDPFFTTREFGRGVGLGLSVAYGTVRELGGRIDVDSTPGHGARFTIVIPRTRDSR